MMVKAKLTVCGLIKNVKYDVIHENINSYVIKMNDKITCLDKCLFEKFTNEEH